MVDPHASARNEQADPLEAPALANPRSDPAATANPRLGLQTRKLLQKHYRARHGVK